MTSEFSKLTTKLNPETSNQTAKKHEQLQDAWKRLLAQSSQRSKQLKERCRYVKRFDIFLAIDKVFSPARHT